MPLNLLRDPWIPVYRRSGVRTLIAPWMLTDGLDDDPIIAPDWPRADLNIAQLELLIGLLFAAMPPSDPLGRDWLKHWREPPTPDALQAAFAPYVDAFNLDGDGPRFLQDFDAHLPGDPFSVDGLLIDAAGGQTIKRNQDHMIKRGRYQRLSRPAAAIVLYALMQFAPAGGAGNRTSMRGGGPMTTLIAPPSHRGAPPSLFHRVWANTPLGASVPVGELATAFPWLAPTRTSEKGAEVHAADAHPAQALFGMPRRMRLIFDDAGGVCDLTGVEDAVTVAELVQRPYGVNYGVWQHPLTPYYRVKTDADWLPLHPKPGRFTIREWASIAVEPGDESVLRRPATVVSQFRMTRVLAAGAQRDPGRLLVAGWAMDNMKPLDFLEEETPLHVSDDPKRQHELDDLAAALAAAAQITASALGFALKSALFGDDAKLDSSALTAPREGFFSHLDAPFHDTLRAVALGECESEPARLDFLATLRKAVLAQFDQTASIDPSDPERIKKSVDARRYLRDAMHGFGKSGTKLFKALEIPSPETKKVKSAS